MRPAGLIPSFSVIGLRSPAPSTREGRGARAALPFPLGLRLAPRPHEATVVACLSPTRGLQPPLASFKTPGCVPRRDAPSAPPRSNALSARITRGLIHPLVFACPPFRENLRAGFPCALGHHWLVTLAPANWGPVFFRTRDVRHRGCQAYAGRNFCLESKLCATCANELDIEKSCRRERNR